MSETKPYIDSYTEEDLASMDPSVAESFRSYAEKLRAKRAKMPANWARIVLALECGAYITTPMYGTTFKLCGTRQRTVSIHKKTAEEMIDCGLLQYSDDGEWLELWK